MSTIDAWGEDPNSWNIDTQTAGIGIGLFSRAVQVWSAMQDRPVTVNDAALAFLCQPERVREAVEWHPWMFLSGDLIEHEGE